MSYLGKSHNSSWQRFLCQTRPPLPTEDFVKKFFAKAREFCFFTFFQLVSSFVILISVVGHSTFAFADPAHDLNSIKLIECEIKTRKYLANFFKKWIFPSFGKDLSSTPPPPFGFQTLAKTS